MSTSGSESRSGLVVELAEEFLDRYRNGQRPPLREYIERHPELAGEIREVFPAMAMMENIALADESLEADATGELPVRRLPPQEQLGDYRIVREVGRGGMGVVYEAEQVSLGRHVALKVLPAQTLRNARQKRRFEREAKAAARLHHTNIVPVFGVGEHDGTPYYVMQFIQGLGLDEVLDELKRMRPGGVGAQAPGLDTGATGSARRDVSAADVARSLLSGRFETGPAAPLDTGTAPPRAASFDATPPPPTLADPAPTPVPPPSGADQSSPSGSSVSLLGTSGAGDGRAARARKSTYWQGAARIGVQVAEALDYAHKQGIVHRDVKPSNLLLDTRGTVWVTDFGLAKADDQQNLTHTGDLLGTLRYMPPEAFEGKTDHRGDVYALGLTLYELLAFRPAFGEKDRGRLVRQVTSEEAPRLGSVNPEVPRDLETVVHKAIDRDPAHRYATAGELAADLQRFLDDEPIQARRASLPERYARWARHHPDLAILGAVLTAVLVVATLASLVAASRFREQARREATIAREREVHRARAEARRAEAEAARAEAESERRHAEALVVDMHAARGLVAAERGEAAHAMLWFARAAALARHDPARERVNRTRARAWEREATVPVLALEHPGQEVTHLAFQPGGGRLLTLTGFGQARLWQLPDGAREDVPGGDHKVTAAAWSPDGAHLALGRAGGDVAVYRMADGARVLALEMPKAVTALAFSRDGSRLAGGGGEARVWDAATGASVGAAMPHPAAVTSLAFGPRGDRLLTGAQDRAARVFDVPTATGRPRFQSAFTGQSKGFEPRFSARGDVVLTFTAGSELTWFDVETGRPTGPGRVALDLSNPRTIAVSPDGRWFAAGGYYGPELFPVDRMAGASRRLGHTNEVTACQFNPDATLLLSSSWDRTVRLWTVPDGSPVGPPLPHEQMVHGAVFAPDGRHLATWQYGGLVRLWRLPGAGRAGVVPDEFPLQVDLRRSRDGRRAIAGRWHNPFAVAPHWTGPIRVYDLATARAVGPAVRLPDPVVDAALDAAGRRAAAVTTVPGGGALHAWDVATGRPLFPPRPLADGDPASVDLSPDGARIAALTRAARFSVFDADDGRLLAAPAWRPRVPIRFAQLRFADARTPVVHSGAELLVWDLATLGPRIPPIPVSRGGERTAVFAISDDGRYAATGTAPLAGVSSFTVRVWDLATGAAASPALAHPDSPFVLAFTPDGRRLVTGSRDGQLRLWDWAAGRLAAPPCKADDEIYSVALLPGARFAITAVRRARGRGRGPVDAWDLASGRRALPSQPLDEGSVGSVAVSADGRHGLACLVEGGLFALDLTDLVDPDPRPTDELVRLAELASGQRVLDGDLVGLTANDWLARYRLAPPRFQDTSAPAPVAAAPAAVVSHPRPDSQPATETGWRPIAREALARQRGRPADSYLGLRAAVFAYLDGGNGYREACGLMLRFLGATDDPLAGERIARACLLGGEALPAATRLAERCGPQLDADGNGWGAAVLALAARRHSRAADARRWAGRAADLFGSRSAGARPFALTLRALADHDLGHDEDAQKALQEARASFGGGASAFLDRAARDPSANWGDPPLQQLDLLFAALLCREAETLILHDPIFPVDPFTR
jgi:WD40 repeat protein